MIKNKLLTFILFLLITFSASLIGGLATINFMNPWYSLLNKPIFNPPDWVFGPIWTILYFMMTISIWLYWHTRNREMNTISGDADEEFSNNFIEIKQNMKKKMRKITLIN